MARHKKSNITAASDILGPRLVLLLTVLILTLIGFVMIYSASSIFAIAEGSPVTSYMVDQLRFAVIGVVACVVLWRIPYQVWLTPVVWAVWGVGVLLLLLTAFGGAEANGAQRWLFIGPFGLQPSEFVKIAFVLTAAKLFSDLRAGQTGGRAFLVQILVFIVVPTGFLYWTQSDLGTTAIIALGIVAVMWLGEVPLRTILVVIGCAILFAVFAVVSSPYRSGRMLFLDPWNDGQGGYGAGYQLIHSFYAFSEGGVFGVGLGNSREKYLWLPESETDFIYSIIGEELGLIGAVAVILLFLVLLWAGLRIARSAADDYGTMIAGSLIIMLVFQAFLNIGCVIGAFPTTGKPLPFISSGGSSLVASYMMIGIILSVSRGSEPERISRRRRDELTVMRPAKSGGR